MEEIDLELADEELEKLQVQLKSLEQVVNDLQNDLLTNLPNFLRFWKNKWTSFWTIMIIMLVVFCYEIKLRFSLVGNFVLLTKMRLFI